MVRVARSAPQATLDDVVSACGGSKRVLLRGLRAATGRGRCDSLIVERFSGLNATRRAAATVVAGGPPPVLRLAAQDSAQRVADALSHAGAGTATWATRGAFHPSPTRQIGVRCLDPASSQQEKNLCLDTSLPPAAIGRVALSVSAPTRFAVIENAACPSYAVAGLAAGGFPRGMAHPRCPRYLLRRLSLADDEDIRHQVARNPSCDPETLGRLAGENSYASRAALEHPACPTQALRTAPATYATAVAANPNCPPELLESIASSGDFWTRSTVLDNPGCAPHIVGKLAHDREPRLRVAAAAHRNCPPALLGGFVHDRDPNVRAAAAARRDCPPELLEVLAADDDAEVLHAVVSNPACPPNVLTHIRELDSTMRLERAANPACPPEHLEHLMEYHSRDESTALAVAQHSNCPHGLLSRLAVHNSPNVALAAAQTIRARRHRDGRRVNGRDGPLR